MDYRGQHFVTSTYCLDDSKDSKKSAAFVHIQRQVLSRVTSVFLQSVFF